MLSLGIVLWSCNTPKIAFKEAENILPVQFADKFSSDGNNPTIINWRDYFKDEQSIKIGHNQSKLININQISKFQLFIVC